MGGGTRALPRGQVIDSIASLLGSYYVLPEAAEGFAEAMRSRQAAGAYDALLDPDSFAAGVSADLVEVTGDAHLLLRVIRASDAGEDEGGALHHPVRLFRLSQRENLGFTRMEWIDEKIGYLDLRRIYPLSESKELVDGAMRFLAGAGAIIIDLRENGGGAGESLPYICSYFFPFPTQLTSYYSRPEDRTTEFWTTREVDGRRRTDVPLFLLTSERTFSAAEILAYDMKVRGRATLVGTATGGGANSVALFPLDETFEVYISTDRAINPVTNDNWEGTGVQPDVAVPSASALDTALVLARKAAEAYQGEALDRMESAVAKMEVAFGRAEAAFREGRSNEGEAALDAMVDAGTELGLVNEFFLAILSYNYTSEEDEGLLYAVLGKRIQLFPSSVEAVEALAGAKARHGKEREAIDLFEKVLEMDPDNRNAAIRLERLRR